MPPQERLREALKALDPVSRALLDLSVRRDIPDEEIAQIVGSDPERVAERRAELLREMAASAGIDGDDERIRADLKQVNWRVRSPEPSENGAPARPTVVRAQESRSIWVLIAAAVLSLLALRRRG